MLVLQVCGHTGQCTHLPFRRSKNTSSVFVNEYISATSGEQKSQPCYHTTFEQCSVIEHRATFFCQARFGWLLPVHQVRRLCSLGSYSDDIIILVETCFLIDYVLVCWSSIFMSDICICWGCFSECFFPLSELAIVFMYLWERLITHFKGLIKALLW